MYFCSHLEKMSEIKNHLPYTSPFTRILRHISARCIWSWFNTRILLHRTYTFPMWIQFLRRKSGKIAIKNLLSKWIVFLNEKYIIIFLNKHIVCQKLLQATNRICLACKNKVKQEITSTEGAGSSLSKLKAAFSSFNFGDLHIWNGSSESLLLETSRVVSEGNENTSSGIFSKRLSCKKKKT